jgi:hypothetical protein
MYNKRIIVTQLVIALVLSPVLTVLVLVLIARRSIRAISFNAPINAPVLTRRA